MRRKWINPEGQPARTGTIAHPSVTLKLGKNFDAAHHDDHVQRENLVFIDRCRQNIKESTALSMYREQNHPKKHRKGANPWQ
jgi:hypothetical protein